MGFLDFLGHAAISSFKEAERETKQHNDLCYQLSDYQSNLNNYLKSVGCDDTYLADWGCIDTGSIAVEKRKMDDIQHKIEQYLSLGGDIRFIEYVDDIEYLNSAIKKVKYLKSQNLLHRQIDFCNDNLAQTQEKISKENEVKNKQQNSNMNVSTDKLSPKQTNVNINETYVIRNVELYSVEDQQFVDFKVKLVYNFHKLDVYMEPVYGVPGFETERFLSSLLFFPESYCNVNISDLDNTERKMVTIGLYDQNIYIMNEDEAFKFKAFYDLFDLEVDKNREIKQNHILEMYNNFDDIDTLALNLLNATDDCPVLLHHDIMIFMQWILSYDMVRSVQPYNPELRNDDNILSNMTNFHIYLGNMAEIVSEKHSISEEEAKFVCWEAVKKNAIKFYSTFWEKSYDKYIDYELPVYENESDKCFLNEYIEATIKCNEIDAVNNSFALSLFTYYIMDKGYTIGKPYFPAYYDIIIKTFDTIKDTIQKQDIKEKLVNPVSNKSINYSINDIDMMTGTEFEHFICELYKKMGYKAEVTKQSNDQGLDIIAIRDNIKIGIQAKCYSNTVGNSAIQEAVAGKNFYQCDKVMVVTNNYFTSSAIELAQVNDVILWNRDMLKEKINELY